MRRVAVRRGRSQSAGPGRRLAAVVPLTFVVLAAVAGTIGGSTGGAMAQTPSYPTIAPPTDEGPQMAPYPVVVPTTAAPTITAPAFAPTATSPSATSPPTTAAPTTTLVPLVGASMRFATAKEHRPVEVDAGFGPVATYRIRSGPTDAGVSTDGIVRWTPAESDGGKTTEITVTAITHDGRVRDVIVRVLVAETNSAPNVDGPASGTAVAGDRFTASYTVVDEDDPSNEITWTVDGPIGMRIDAGVVNWEIGPEFVSGEYEATITATDDGDPSISSTRHLLVTVDGIAGSILAAVDGDGRPLNPMVIAAAAGAPPLPVDLDRPGDLMVAIGMRTPTIEAIVPPGPPKAETNRRGVVATVLNRGAVIASVRRTLRVLLDLEVPTAAVAGGLAWQLMLLFTPGLLTRNNELFDIVGLRDGQEIGDDRFRYRSDATSLRASGRRWRSGTWMRQVDSPHGSVWIPDSNLRSSHKAR